MAEDPRSGFTEVQGIRLHYREWGDPGTPDLLLVHGWTNYSLGWAGVAEHFAAATTWWRRTCGATASRTSP